MSEVVELSTQWQRISRQLLEMENEHNLGYQQVRYTDKDGYDVIGNLNIIYS